MGDNSFDAAVLIGIPRKRFRQDELDDLLPGPLLANPSIRSNLTELVKFRPQASPYDGPWSNAISPLALDMEPHS